MIRPVPYSVDPSFKSTSVRFSKMIALVGEPVKRVLNLGDGYASGLSKGLLAEGHELFTLDSFHKADLLFNLEDGLPDDVFKTASFDVVVAGELFEHIYHLKRLLSGIKRVLTPSGSLVLSVPNVCNLRSRVRVLLGHLPSYAADGDLYEMSTNYHGHVRDFNFERINLYLKQAGFMVVESTNNGLYLRWKRLLPGELIPNSFGDNIIIKAVKQ